MTTDHSPHTNMEAHEPTAMDFLGAGPSSFLKEMLVALAEVRTGRGKGEAQMTEPELAAFFNPIPPLQDYLT